MDPRASGAARARKAGDTRQRLMDASLDLLFEEGPSALSTVRIAQRAGIVQSGFYKHFPSVDACVLGKAQQLRTGLAAPVLEGLRAFHEADPTDRAHLARVLEQLFDAALEHRKLFVLMMRHRHELSVLGEEFRLGLNAARDSYAESLWALALRLGMPAKQREAIDLLAEVLFEAVVTGAYEVVEGRRRSKRGVAQMLSRTLIAAGIAEFRHLLGPLVPAAEAKMRASRGATPRR
jgi:AcrR family transcriptional regulator